MDNIKIIQDAIRGSGYLYFWYIKKDDMYYNPKSKPLLIVAGMTEEETLKRVEELGLKEGTELYSLSIELFSKEQTNKFFHSLVAVKVSTYIIKNGKVIFDNTWQKLANGYIWFNESFLERRGWTYFYLNDIINKVARQFVKPAKFGLIWYEKI